MILSSDLLEDNWILFRLISEVNILKWERKAENSHYNTEKICQEVYPKFRNIVDSRWINHVCSEIGCEKRIIVCDGNEKLYRYCCALPIEKVQGESGNANCLTGCPVKQSDASCGSSVTGWVIPTSTQTTLRCKRGWNESQPCTSFARTRLISSIYVYVRESCPYARSSPCDVNKPKK